MSSNRGHRAGQCAPEVPRTRIRARGDLQERRTRPSYSHIQHPTPAPRSGDKPHPAPNTCAHGQATSLITHRIPAPTARRLPHSAEIRRWCRQSVQMGRKICFVRADAIHGETFPAESGTLPRGTWRWVASARHQAPRRCCRNGGAEAKAGATLGP